MGKHSEEFVEAGEPTELMKTDVGSQDGRERRLDFSRLATGEEGSDNAGLGEV